VTRNASPFRRPWTHLKTDDSANPVGAVRHHMYQKVGAVHFSLRIAGHGHPGILQDLTRMFFLIDVNRFQSLVQAKIDDVSSCPHTKQRREC